VETQAPCPGVRSSPCPACRGAVTCAPQPRVAPMRGPDPDPTGHAQPSHRPGQVLKPERLLRAPESRVTHLRAGDPAPHLPRTKPPGWRRPRRGPRVHPRPQPRAGARPLHPSCAGLDPHPCRELSAGCRGVRGVPASRVRVPGGRAGSRLPPSWHGLSLAVCCFSPCSWSGF